MKPFFSVIIPTLNEENCLPKLLKNLQNQHIQNFEIIVVDGNSTDNTLKEVQKYKPNLKVFRIIQAKKRNVSFQRNLGAIRAQGKYLLFLDADTGVYPSFTKRLQQAIEKRGGLLFILSLVADEKSARNTLIFSIVNAVIEASQTLGKPIPTPSVTVIEKRFFHTIGRFNEHIGLTEDHDLLLRARRWGVTGKFLRDSKVIFSMRRFRKDGEIRLLSTYMSSTIQMLVHGRIKGEGGKYEMGGHIFDKREMNVKASPIK